MPTTQYIGSRYVPLLANPVEWSSTKEYEPLTIVTHEGNSYTSRQYVPKGIDIDNEAYWALTGNYNAQIELYRRETAQAVEIVRQLTEDAVSQVDTWLQDAQGKYGAKPFAFNTVEDMQRAYELLYVGAICHTNGFHVIGDDGAAWYVISDTGLANRKDVLACGNLFANLIVTEPYVKPEQFGAYGNGTNDDTEVLQYILDNYSIIKGNKTYLIDTVYIQSYKNIDIYSIQSNTPDYAIHVNGYYTNIDIALMRTSNGHGFVFGDQSRTSSIKLSCKDAFCHKRCVTIDANSFSVSGVRLRGRYMSSGANTDCTIFINCTLSGSYANDIFIEQAFVGNSNSAKPAIKAVKTAGEMQVWCIEADFENSTGIVLDYVDIFRMSQCRGNELFSKQDWLTVENMDTNRSIWIVDCMGVCRGAYIKFVNSTCEVFVYNTFTRTPSGALFKDCRVSPNGWLIPLEPLQGYGPGYEGNKTIVPYDFVVPTYIDYYGNSSGTLVMPTTMYARTSCNEFEVRVRNNITLTLEFTKPDESIVKTIQLSQGLYQFKITNQSSPNGILYWSVQ